MSDRKEALQKLREPFEKHQIGKLPKPHKRDAAVSNCAECGGRHGQPATHIDYVGHAAVTDRVLDVDLEWDWEPFALDEHELPKFDANGGLWIRLTVAGKTRIGYGDAQGKRGGDATKEAIGDAIRNAAMRFGVGLELWHKGDLRIAETTAPGSPSSPLQMDYAGAARAELLALLGEIGVPPGEAAERFAAEHNVDIERSKNVAAIKALTAHYKKMAGRA